MTNIPPTTGPSQPPHVPEPSNELAKKLANTTGNFIEQTQNILNSPHLADDQNILDTYANCILNLYQLSQETGE